MGVGCVYESCEGVWVQRYELTGGGLSRVWCVKRVLVDWNSLNYRDWKEGGEEKVHHYIIHVTFSLFMNKL